MASSLLKQNPENTQNVSTVKPAARKVESSPKRRKDKKTKSAAVKSHAEAKVCFLYVQIHDFLKETDFKNYINRRIKHAVDFDLDLLSRSDINPKTVARLQFPSNTKAKLAVKHIQRSNRSKGQTKLRWSFFDERSEKVKVELEKKIQQAFIKHDRKIREARERLKAIPMKNVPYHLWDERETERQVLEEKILELQKQREGFQKFIEKYIFSVLKENNIDPDKFQKEINALRRKFGIELSRLRKAFPIYARRQEIVDALLNNQVLVLRGETGSGKSTQIPQYLLDAGFAESGLIACTQPRKIAASSLATHVSTEVDSRVGDIVGYKVGTRDQISSNTKIIYLTDQSLLNEVLGDRTLTKYSCVIIDEAHERSIYTDLLIGMLRQAMSDRPDLKVVITSATIDTDIFVKYFDGCQVIKVSGRTFPVEVIWDPLNSVDKESYLSNAVKMAADIHDIEGEGDILVFVTSGIETEKGCELFQERMKTRSNFKCFQLHGKLQADEQQKVFKQLSDGQRKVVFATNIAETSVTIPGIRYVVDTGLVKEMRYEEKKGLNSLDTVVVSKSSAEQKKGRAGRMSSGKCFRLYTEEEYKDMRDISLPEILRVQLSQGLLKLLDLGVDPMAFHFLESPSKVALTTAMCSLNDLEAVKEGKITELGRRLALLPFEPRLGKMLLTGIDEGLSYEAICIVALTTMGSSIFYRAGTDADKLNSDLLKTRFCHPDGDHMTMLNVYREWFNVPKKDKNKWCVENSINATIMKKVKEMADEVITLLKRNQIKTVRVNFLPNSDAEDKLRLLIFQSSKQNIAFFLGNGKADYVVAGRNQKARIHPSSSVNVMGEKPEWIIFEQLINTSQDFVTVVSPVPSEWIYNASSGGTLKFDPCDLEKLKVSLIMTKDLGALVFSDFVGPRFTKLTFFEEHLQTQIENTIVCLDANRNNLQIYVHSNTNCKDAADLYFNQKVSFLLNQLRLATQEIPLADNCSVRAVVERGGVINSLLFGKDFRSVFIDSVQQGTTYEDFYNWLLSFSSELHLKKWQNKKGANGVRWGTATFKDSTEASNAVAKNTDNDLAKLVPCISNVKCSGSNEFIINVKLERRESKGSGFVTFHNAQDRINFFLKKVFLVHGNLVRINLPKKEDAHTVFVVRLPVSAVEDNVKEAIEGLPDFQGAVKNVLILRKGSFEPTQAEIQLVRNSISSAITSHCPGLVFELTLRDLVPTSAFYSAYVHIADPDKGVEAFNRLKGRLYVNDKYAHIMQNLNCKIFVPKYLLNALSSELDRVSQIHKEMTTIKETTSRAGHRYINIKSESTEVLSKVKQSYDSVLRGRPLNLTQFGEDSKFLFSRDGREKIKDIEQRTGTVILLDPGFQSARVLGSLEKLDKADKLIKEFLDKRANFPTKKMFLCGDGKPPGVLKILLRTFGLDFAILKEKAGLESVELNFRWQTLMLMGSSDSLDKAEVCVEECIRDLGMPKVTDSTQIATVDCVVCFCPVDDGQLFRLNVCAHAHCRECAKLQVTSAINGRDLPLKCTLEGCDDLWCWKDVAEILGSSGLIGKDLLKAAMDSFISENKEKYHFCLTPDCPVVFPLSDEGKLFICSACGIRICTSCKVQYHDGLSCAMYNQNPDPGVQEWLQTDKINHKLCPKCGIPIQKDGGCLHVTCKCNAHICWVCLKFFSTGSACYDHLSSSHGRLGDEYLF